MQLPEFYDALNAYWFAGRLPKVNIILDRRDVTDDFWAEHVKDAWEHEGYKKDEIRFNATKFPLMTKEEFYAMFVHEMVHVWQESGDGPRPRGKGDYHDRAFADKLISLGVMPSGNGRAGGRQTGIGMHEYIVHIPAAMQAAIDALVLPVVRRSGVNNRLVRGFK